MALHLHLETLHLPSTWQNCVFYDEHFWVSRGPAKTLKASAYLM